VRKSLALATLLAAMLGCGSDPVTRVVLVGDSITRGSVRGGGASFAERLAELLGRRYEVVNAGCSGSSSIDWTLSRPSRQCGGEGRVEQSLFEAKLAPALPAPLVVLMLGTNDALAFHEPAPVAAEDYERALREILRESLDRGAAEIILLTPPPNPRSNPELHARLAGYRERVQTICHDTDRVHCGPDIFTLLDAGQHFNGVNAHPNASGHREIAEALARSVRERS